MNSWVVTLRLEVNDKELIATLMEKMDVDHAERMRIRRVQLGGAGSRPHNFSSQHMASRPSSYQERTSNAVDMDKVIILL